MNLVQLYLYHTYFYTTEVGLFNWKLKRLFMREIQKHTLIGTKFIFGQVTLNYRGFLMKNLLHAGLAIINNDLHKNGIFVNTHLAYLKLQLSQKVEERNSKIY